MNPTDQTPPTPPTEPSAPVSPQPTPVVTPDPVPATPVAQPAAAPTPQPVQSVTQPTAYGQPPSKSSSNKKIVMIAGIVAAVVVLAGIGFFVFGKKGGGTGGGSVIDKLTNDKALTLKTYTNTDYKFSLDTPEGWKTDTSKSSSFASVQFVEPAADLKDKSEAAKHIASIFVFIETDIQDYSMPKDAADYFSTTKENLRSEIDDASKQTGTLAYEKYEVKDEKEITVNGKSAYRVTLKANNYDSKSGETGVETRLYVYVDAKRQYEIRFHAHDSEKEAIGKVDDIFNSFKAL